VGEFISLVVTQILSWMLHHFMQHSLPLADRAWSDILQGISTSYEWISM